MSTELNLDGLEERYLAFQPLVLLTQSLFAGLIALVITTLVGDILSRITVYKISGTWPDWAPSLIVYTGLITASLVGFLLARWVSGTSHIGLRFLCVLLTATILAQLMYGASRFVPALQLNPTFALDWLPFAAVALYLFFLAAKAGVFAFRTDRVMSVVLSQSPSSSIFSGAGVRRAIGMPVVADWLCHRRWLLTTIILLSTLALAWLPFTVISGTSGMPIAVDSITVTCPKIVAAIEDDPEIFNQDTIKQLGWDRLPINEADCINAVLPQNAQFPSVTWLNKWALVVASFVIPILFGGLAWRYARSHIRFSIDELTKSDTRAPVLFLRPFVDDQVALRHEQRSLLLATLEVGRNHNTLDEVMLDEATTVGPVVALGNPRDDFPPYGAARNYFSNKDWQQAVIDLCEKSSAIVIVMDAAENVVWEVRHIFDKGYEEKTLFLLHPTLTGESGDAEARAKVECELLALARGQLEKQSLSRSDLVGFFIRAGAPRYSISSTLSRAAYLLTTRAFFRSRDSAQLA